MVLVRHGNRIERLVEFAQRDRLDEESTISVPPGVHDLYRHRHISPAVLGHRDIRQLYLLQQHQQALSQDSSVGTSISVRPIVNQIAKSVRLFCRDSDADARTHR